MTSGSRDGRVARHCKHSEAIQTRNSKFSGPNGFEKIFFKEFFMNKTCFRKEWGFALLAAAVLVFTGCNNTANPEGELGLSANSAFNKAETIVRLENYYVPGNFDTLAEAFEYIEADSNVDYEIHLTADVTSDPIDVTSGGFAGKTITLIDDGLSPTGYTVTLVDTGSLFTLGSTTSPVTLTVDGKVTLEGIDPNKTPLIGVNAGGILNLTGNAVITGNNNANTSAYGGGIAVSGGTVSMAGNSSVTANQVSGTGGGLYINGGTFTLSGNSSVTNNNSQFGGGGVFAINGSTVTIQNNSLIDGNQAASGEGGGVYITGETTVMTLNGGTISNNTTTRLNSGGVHVVTDATFNMSAGTISGNQLVYSGGKGGGGGVSVLFGGVFNMSGGTISGNSVASGENNKGGIYGGGVYVSIHDSTFNLTGGVISGNTVYHANASAPELIVGGGGICLDNGFYSDNLTFAKLKAVTGAVVYGYSNPVSATSNNVIIGSSSSSPVAGYGSAILVVTSQFGSGNPQSITKHVESDVGSSVDISAVYEDPNNWVFTGNWPN
jgi:hypothetical protein